MTTLTIPVRAELIVEPGKRASAGAQHDVAESDASYDLWGRLEPGPHSVGFRVFHKVDLSRLIQPEVEDGEDPLAAETRGRPLQIAVWYPAHQPAEGSTMRYEEYARLELTEAGIRDDAAHASSREVAERFVNYAYLSAEVAGADAQQILQNGTAAFRDAHGKSGSYPTILIAQGNIGPIYRHSILAEYLASHGYIVATSPGVAKLPRSSHDSPIFEQLSDLLYVRDFLTDFPGVDSERTALIASSYGGGAVGQWMMEDANIDAVISLDSFLSMGFGLAEAKFDQSPNYTAAKSRSTPILNLYQEQEGLVQHDLGYLNSFQHADRYHVRMNEMQHFNLTSMGMFASMWPELVGNPKLLAGGTAAELGHEIMCRYVLHFLEATFRGSPESLAFLESSPEENGFPEGFLTPQVHKAVESM